MFTWVDYSPARYGAYVYPVWADAVGWLMSLSVVVWIPVYAVVAVRKQHDPALLQVSRVCSYRPFRGHFPELDLLLLRNPSDQRPLVSIACLVMSFHLLRSWAKLFSSCSPVLHQLTVSSIHTLHGLPLLFVPSTIPNISVFNFLFSSILHMWPNSRSFF